MPSSFARCAYVVAAVALNPSLRQKLAARKAAKEGEPGLSMEKLETQPYNAEEVLEGLAANSRVARDLSFDLSQAGSRKQLLEPQGMVDAPTDILAPEPTKSMVASREASCPAPKMLILVNPSMVYM